MAKFKRRFDFATDKFSGKAKEAVGKATGNEQLELNGKIHAAKADLKENMSVERKVDEIKEKISGKINDKLDEKKK